MANKGYIGQAGTGKTTKIIEDLNDLVKPEEWAKTSSILAITYMHGSRRRLENKLSPFVKKGVRVNCMTIDAFCLHIVQRYKSYLGIKSQIIVSDNVDENTKLEEEKKLICGIHTICQIATELLDFKIVKEVMKFSYPIIVVDEFQDCEEGHLQIIKKISENNSLLIAADDFQKLDNELNSLAVNWLNESIICEELSTIFRTNDNKILNSARALRNNTQAEDAIEVKFVASKDLAAWTVASQIEWYSKMEQEGRSLALISPVGQKNAFIRDTLNRLQRGFEKSNLRPHPFIIESEKKITVDEVLKKCTGLGKKIVLTVEMLESWKTIDDICLQMAITYTKRIMKLRNSNSISVDEFKRALSSRLHFASTFLSIKKDNRVFLTVHGAKNREFDDVFILWPQYGLVGNELYLRKLMYNAVTRARRKVILIVQGTRDERISEPVLNLLVN